MKTPDISTAKNADLRASLAALQRAAKSARQIAIQTDTAIVVVKDGKLVRITADDLRQEATDKTHTSSAVKRLRYTRYPHENNRSFPDTRNPTIRGGRVAAKAHPR